MTYISSRNFAPENRSVYVSYGYGPSLFAVATAWPTALTDTQQPKHFGINFSLKPALLTSASCEEQPPVASGIHHLDLALFSEQPRDAVAELQMICEPANGKAFDVQLSPNALLAPTPESAQFDSDLVLAPGTYYFLVIVDRNARANFLIEI